MGLRGYKDVAPTVPTVQERVQSLAAFFKTNSTNRPKKRKTLESQIHAMFGKTLSLEEVEQTIQQLVAAKIITLNEKGAVTYSE